MLYHYRIRYLLCLDTYQCDVIIVTFNLSFGGLLLSRVRYEVRGSNWSGNIIGSRLPFLSSTVTRPSKSLTTHSHMLIILRSF